MMMQHHPLELVDLALHELQAAGIEPIEWGAHLYRRMNVPTIVQVSLGFMIIGQLNPFS